MRGSILHALVLCMGFALPAQSQEVQASDDSPKAGNRVLVFPEDQTRAYVIPTSPLVTTTIVMPARISDFNGRGFVDPGQSTKSSGDFEIGFAPETRYFSVSPYREGVTRNLNVICEGKIYAFEMVPSADPAKTPTVVYIGVDPNPRPEPQGLDVEVSSTAPKSRIVSSGAAQIVGAMDTLKMLTALPDRKTVAKALKLVPGAILSHRSPPATAKFNTHDITLTDVLRLDPKDILVFRFELTNRCEQSILIDSESFLVRCGDDVYSQVTADVAPLIEPKQTVVGFVAIIGSPDGSPNNLKPDNDFLLSVNLVDAPAPPVTAQAAQTRKSRATPTPTPTLPTAPVSPLPTIQRTLPTPSPAATPPPSPTPTPWQQPRDEKGATIIDETLSIQIN